MASSNGAVMTWKQVQLAFNRAGRRISKKDAQMVVNQLPKAVIATGWDKNTMLHVLTTSDAGALERLRAL